MVPILSGITDLRMNRFNLVLLIRSLGHRKAISVTSASG